MDVTFVESGNAPEFARAMVESVSSTAPIAASSSSTRDEETVAWAVAVEEGARVLVYAVAKRDPNVVVALRLAGTAFPAMTVARSLIDRSGKRFAEGGLVPAHFGDLDGVPFERCAPQFVLAKAADFGLPVPNATMAIGCTWQDMALDPEARPAAVLARSKEGVTADALEPLDRALDGLSRSLRKAKEPLSSNAAWALQSLIPLHLERVRQRLQDLVLVEKLSEERQELFGALVDGLNPALVEAAETNAPADGSPRVVLCQRRLPPTEKATSGRVVVVYFYAASHKSSCKLQTRHPEGPLAASAVTQGFAHLDEVFEKHQVTIRDALAARGALALQRGFHADVSLTDAIASFKTDGFLPIALVLDA
jgi:hypothetical protein